MRRSWIDAPPQIPWAPIQISTVRTRRVKESPTSVSAPMLRCMAIGIGPVFGMASTATLLSNG